MKGAINQRVNSTSSIKICLVENVNKLHSKITTKQAENKMVQSQVLVKI